MHFDRSSLTRWRQRMGEEKLQALLQESLAVATRTDAMKPPDLARVVIDTTVQPKAVMFPTESASAGHRCSWGWAGSREPPWRGGLRFMRAPLGKYSGARAAGATDEEARSGLAGRQVGSDQAPALRLSVAATTVFIRGSLDTNSATSCEMQLPFWRRRHPRRIVSTPPCAGAKCGAGHPSVPDCRRERGRAPRTLLLNWQSNPSARLG
jgi:hypothetical protein